MASIGSLDAVGGVPRTGEIRNAREAFQKFELLLYRFPSVPRHSPATTSGIVPQVWGRGRSTPVDLHCALRSAQGDPQNNSTSEWSSGKRHRRYRGSALQCSGCGPQRKRKTARTIDVSPWQNSTSRAYWLSASRRCRRPLEHRRRQGRLLRLPDAPPRERPPRLLQWRQRRRWFRFRRRARRLTPQHVSRCLASVWRATSDWILRK